MASTPGALSEPPQHNDHRSRKRAGPSTLLPSEPSKRSCVGDAPPTLPPLNPQPAAETDEVIQAYTTTTWNAVSTFFQDARNEAPYIDELEAKVKQAETTLSTAKEELSNYSNKTRALETEIAKERNKLKAMDAKEANHILFSERAKAVAIETVHTPKSEHLGMYQQHNCKYDEFVAMAEAKGGMGLIESETLSGGLSHDY
ncbi:hypothetical protein FCIRC_13556 [Fusarium circinatum]|uniref:Uncharacterized protein n=1 Tax=Fusarium circinatum TaxID=48490 RepID=A0A8H5ST72_FUSCI|nr:hypothetical protein FCIRC_13556 [Fusarium circinatum]